MIELTMYRYINLSYYPSIYKNTRITIQGHIQRKSRRKEVFFNRELVLWLSYFFFAFLCVSFLASMMEDWGGREGGGGAGRDEVGCVCGGSRL